MQQKGLQESGSEFKQAPCLVECWISAIVIPMNFRILFNTYSCPDVCLTPTRFNQNISHVTLVRTFRLLCIIKNTAHQSFITTWHFSVLLLCLIISSSPCRGVYFTSGGERLSPNHRTPVCESSIFIIHIQYSKCLNLEALRIQSLT